MISVTGLLALDIQCCNWKHSCIPPTALSEFRNTSITSLKTIPTNLYKYLDLQLPSSPDSHHISQIPTVPTYLHALRIPLHLRARISISTVSSHSPNVKQIHIPKSKSPSSYTALLESQSRIHILPRIPRPPS